MATDEEFDDIPTLSDIVFPGNPEKIIAKQAAPDTDLIAPDRKEPKVVRNNTLESVNPYIEDEIDNIVESVLAKHFFKVRKEIVEEIMRELNKKIP